MPEKTDIKKEELPLASECSVEWLYQYYSKALIWSDSAKASWVDPDIRPLEF